MAQLPMQQTIKQTTMIMEEEFAPPRPDTDRSPSYSPRSQDTSGASSSLGILSTMDDSLTRPADSRGAKCPFEKLSNFDECPASPQTPVGQPTQKDMVEPVLQDMIKLANFGLNEFHGETHKHLYNVRAGLNDNVNALHNIRNKMVQSAPVVENGAQFIQDFIQMWISNGQYFTQVYNECENPNSSVPDLRNVNHPSPEITQEAYKQLIWNMVLLCQRAERQMRLQDLMYCSMDEALEETKGKLDGVVKTLRHFDDVSCSMDKGDSTLLQKFGEELQKVNRFLSEWQKGGDQFNQPSPRQTPEAGVRRTSPMTPSPATQESTTGTPNEEIEGRVKSLEGKKAEMVEDLLRRYNELSKTVLREVQTTMDLEQSVIDMHKTQ